MSKRDSTEQAAAKKCELSGQRLCRIGSGAGSAVTPHLLIDVNLLRICTAVHSERTTPAPLPTGPHEPVRLPCCPSIRRAQIDADISHLHASA